MISCATEVENRNNVSPRTIIDNDMLGTAPNVNRILTRKSLFVGAKICFNV